MVFRPISEYSVIGNDDRIALVDRTGSIDWCCFPHVGAASVFGRLLDGERGGHFLVRPTDSYRSGQDYRRKTNVLRTRFQTDSGRATLTDFMPITDDDRPTRYQHSVYRKFRCDEGRLSVEVDFKPRFRYATTTPTIESTERGVLARDSDETPTPDEEPALHHCQELHLQVAGPIDLDCTGDRAVGTVVVEEGQTIWLVLQSDHFRPMPPTKCERERTRTLDYWQEWARQIEPTAAAIVGDEDWEEEILRSALVLKLLINDETGGIYAAATTSLPEEYGGDRNWDYRFSWIRDAKFTVQALFNLGASDEASDYFEWFRRISHEDPADIQPLYGIHGEHELTERVLDHLSGYRFSTPVRIGNAASEQRQLDSYGTIVQGIYEIQRHAEKLSPEDWASIRRLVEYVCEVWDERGRGIWEFRQPPRQYVHSKLLCWVAVDRGIRLAARHDDDFDVTEWRDTRDEIREAIERRGYSESAGSFVQHFETEETLDAACLLIPIYEFLPPDDPRVQGTIDTALAELATDEGLVRRSKGPDAPPEGRGRFLLCTFWLVDALVLADRTAEARRIFPNVLEHVETPSLLPERLDPDTGEYLGNYPQAFSHIGLLNSAVYLSSELGEGDLVHDPQRGIDLHPLFRL